MPEFDIVSDSQELIVTRRGGRYDMLKRPRLPDVAYLFELEWRKHPVDFPTRLLLINYLISNKLFSTFCWVILFIAPLSNVLGGWIYSPGTYPLAVLGAAIYAYQKFAKTHDLLATLLRFTLPQIAFIYLELSFSSTLDQRWHLIPVASALWVVGYVTDKIHTHCMRWNTADLELEIDDVHRLRDLWRIRFNWFLITRDIRGLQEQLTVLGSADDNTEVQAIRGQVKELRELRQYALGFLILPFFLLLFILGASATAIIIWAIVCAIVLAVKRGAHLQTSVKGLLLDVIVWPFISWISWDTSQLWVLSPGLFNDRLYSPLTRVEQTSLCFVLLQVSFIPPIHRWVSGPGFTPLWSWMLAYNFLIELMLPVVMVGATLVATGMSFQVQVVEEEEEQ